MKVIDGTESSEEILGTDSRDQINGLGGSDLIFGGEGHDVIDGGSSNDQIYGGRGNDTCYGLDGSDVIYGDEGDDYLAVTQPLNPEGSVEPMGFAYGGSGNDRVVVTIGENLDQFNFGGSGNDTLSIFAEDYYNPDLKISGDLIFDGQASDFEYITFGFSLHFDSGKNRIDFSSIKVGFQSIYGGKGNDNIDFGTNYFWINGDEGSDTIRGGGYLSGGDGADVVIATSDSSIFAITASDLIEDDLRLFSSANSAELVGGATSGTLTTESADLLSQFSRISISGTVFASSGNDVIDFRGMEVSYGIFSEDRIDLGAGNDVYYGSTGNDRIDSGEGIDTLTGGLGNDTYFVDSPKDVVIEKRDGGRDRIVIADANYDLGVSPNIEEVDAYGSTRGVSLTGNDLDNVISGGIGNDTITDSAGSDWVFGGNGADTYIINNIMTEIDDFGEDGAVDTVKTSMAYYRMPQYIESLVFTGKVDNVGYGFGFSATAVYGGAGNDSLYDGMLYGGSGDDFLSNAMGAGDYFGGSGQDTLIGNARPSGNIIIAFEQNKLQGGEGDDVYELSLEGLASRDRLYEYDIIVELQNEGIDLVKTDIPEFTLVNNVENLVYSGKIDAVLTGNDLGNSISAGMGLDVIEALGGHDTLFGRDSDDHLYGGDGKDSLDGGAGNDELDGGPGQSTLVGGSGDDLYWVMTNGDKIIETASGGIDTIYLVAKSYTMSDYVENLFAATDAGVSVTGNGGDNQIYGGLGDDSLKGGSGSDILCGVSGDDTLMGQSGADYFYFVDDPAASGFVTVEDFKSDDTILIWRGVADYFELPPGGLDPTAFKILGQGSLDATDRFLYDQATGKLYFDADGSGNSGRELIAVFTNQPKLDAGDFLLI